MVTVYFDEYYLRYTNNASDIVVQPGTVGDVIRSMYNSFPQLLVLMLDNLAEEAKKTVIILNDEELIDVADLHKELAVGDTLELLRMPHGNDLVSVGVAIVDVIGSMGPAGFAVAETLAESAIVLGMLGAVAMVGVQLALTVILGALVNDIAAPSINSGSLGNSATYTFNGIFNTTASGTPIQVVYGKCRTGGQIISLFTEGSSFVSSDTTTVTPDQTMLFYQIGLCEGEIEKIQDVYINKMPRTFYNAVYTYPEVEDYLRKGTDSQTVIKDFNKILTTTSMNRKVQSTASPITSEVDTSATTYSPMYGYVEAGQTTPTTGDYKLTYVADYVN